MKSNKVEEKVVPPKKSRDDVIQIYPLENPAYVSEDNDFLGLVREFEADIQIPSIRYESIHNYIATIVQGIYDQKLRGIKDELITYKVQIGFVNGKLSGFSVFYLLPNRLPHIQTIDWAYCHSKDIRLSYKFCLELQKYRKAWKARRISFVATNKVLDRIAKRLFKNAKPCGTYWVCDDVRSNIIKS
jgi:hypothetical protein